MSFGTKFWDVILGWYYNILGWKLSEKLLVGPKQVFFSVGNHNKFSSQNIIISSQNNVPKYHTKGHEQIYIWQVWLTRGTSKMTWIDSRKDKKH